MIFKKVGIVGTGLIGGSLAQAMKKRKIACQIVGVSRHKETLAIAKRIKAIDRGSQDLNILKDADLVILATPVSTIINLAYKIAKVIGKNCIVTDTGSTKAEIVSRLEKIFPRYIGAHPLAGSEKRSIKNANSNLFDGSVCIITPTKKSDAKAKSAIVKLWKGVGAKIITLSPDAHDQALSFTSHLPHILAFSLMRSVPNAAFKFASGGLKDTTRIAASDAEIWSDIFLANRKNIVKALDLWLDNLETLIVALKKNDRVALSRIIQEAKEKREKLG